MKDWNRSFTIKFLNTHLWTEDEFKNFNKIWKSVAKVSVTTIGENMRVLFDLLKYTELKNLEAYIA